MLIEKMTTHKNHKVPEERHNKNEIITTKKCREQSPDCSERYCHSSIASHSE